MNDERERVAANASLLWRSGSFQLASDEYEKLLRLSESPLDQAKVLANIAQLDEKRGSPQRAIERAIEAMRIVYEHELYETFEGSHLRGYLHGFLNHLEHKTSKDPLAFELPGSLEMRLVPADRRLLHFGMGVIGTTSAAYAATFVHLGQIDLVWKHGTVKSFSIAGLLISQMVSQRCFKWSTVLVAAVTRKPLAECLRTALGLITAAAICCLLAMPSQFVALVKEMRWYILTALIGCGYWSLFLSRRHGRPVRYDPPNAA